NDYTEHPGQRLRPGSAPASSGVLTSSIRDAGRHREDRHHRHHRDPRHRNRSRRHCHALPLPGSATRMTTASLPSHLVSRDLRLADSGRFAPAVPARPFTIGHSQPRRQLRGNPADGNGNNKLGEVCPRCKNCPRCRESGNGEPETPRGSRHCWMCNRRCACTVHDCVEVATCVYCVRAGLYHCTNYDDNEDLADKPCSCRGSDCCLRWTALSVLSIFLPCLLCYPIAMGCSRACKACSPKQGCKCKDSYSMCCHLGTIYCSQINKAP
uniref:Protein sprouty homolog 2 n=1 Tax=Ciona intestinalis TaxID=7719 RepID=H2XKK1_CIOIN